MNTITKDDFLSMVRLLHLEVIIPAQLVQNTQVLRGYMEKALTSELSEAEKSDANVMVEDVAGFDKWCVLRNDFTKAIVYTRREQIAWDGAERGEFGEIIKARGGIYKLTGENKKLGRVGQKYGEKKETLSDIDTPIANMLKDAKQEHGEKKEEEFKVGDEKKEEFSKKDQTRIKRLMDGGWTREKAEDQVKNFEDESDIFVKMPHNSRGYTGSNPK